MNSLFYSKEEKKAFWVSGYCYDHSEFDVDKIIENLKANKDKFIAYLKIESTVKTFEIFRSCRYKGMRVFYSENIESCPEGFFEIGKDWTMFKWLES